jgi:hypothetical protein
LVNYVRFLILETCKPKQKRSADPPKGTPRAKKSNVDTEVDEAILDLLKRDDDKLSTLAMDVDSVLKQFEATGNKPLILAFKTNIRNILFQAETVLANYDLPESGSEEAE